MRLNQRFLSPLLVVSWIKIHSSAFLIISLGIKFPSFTSLVQSDSKVMTNGAKMKKIK